MDLYQFAFYAHMAGLAFSVAAIVYADHLGFSWVRGKTQTLEESKLKRVHYSVWVALIVMISSGLFMFWPAKEALLAQPVFLLKIFFVLCLVINGLFVGKLMGVAAEKSFSSLTAKEKLPLIVSGGVSSISWIGAAASAVVFFGL